jgi:hypothetical protein
MIGDLIPRGIWLRKVRLGFLRHFVPGYDRTVPPDWGQSPPLFEARSRLHMPYVSAIPPKAGP